MIAEAGYMCNVAEQQRYLTTTARSKSKGEITESLDRVSLTACSFHERVSFTVIDHLSR